MHHVLPRVVCMTIDKTYAFVLQITRTDSRLYVEVGVVRKRGAHGLAEVCVGLRAVG
jgi:hypothetical protein